METSESLLKAILATVGCRTFTPESIAKVLSVGTGGKKQFAAFNLCDGLTPQAQIAKKTGLDQGNLSRSLTRWIEAGIVFRVGKDGHPLHVYPVFDSTKAK